MDMAHTCFSFNVSFVSGGIYFVACVLECIVFQWVPCEELSSEWCCNFHSFCGVCTESGKSSLPFTYIILIGMGIWAHFVAGGSIDNLRNFASSFSLKRRSNARPRGEDQASNIGT